MAGGHIKRVLNGMANLEAEAVTAKNKMFLLDYNEPSCVLASLSVLSVRWMCPPALSFMLVRLKETGCSGLGDTDP